MTPQGVPNQTSFFLLLLNAPWVLVYSHQKQEWRKRTALVGFSLPPLCGKDSNTAHILVTRTDPCSRLLSVSMQILSLVTPPVFAAAPVKRIRAHKTIQSYRWNLRIDQCVIILSTKYEHSGAPVKHINKLKHTHKHTVFSPCLLKSLSTGLIKKIHTSAALIHGIL